MAPKTPRGDDSGAGAGYGSRLPRFYGRRKGKPIRAGKQDVLDALLPKLAIPAPRAGERLALASLFAFTPKEIWLEVGFGSGEHTAAQAETHPDVGFIGSEVFLNGIGGLLKHIAAAGLTNIRVFPEDVRRLLPALPDGCLARVFVLFPDPWPKKRHAGRRFIGPDNLDQLARLLMPGGELRIASDHPIYVDWVREQMAARPDFAPCQDAAVRPEGWAPSRYEQKALEQGILCSYMAWKRR
ncbi:MAG: tRNA (guanosine(46)-N7)-methyltransferase TrmB [Alphaproteobacteria bacterium]|nr:tRNA (guanosine(46)-N7)-methyltransferase TrmB [Alphaproteobacteria bacterium]